MASARKLTAWDAEARSETGIESYDAGVWSEGLAKCPHGNAISSERICLRNSRNLTPQSNVYLRSGDNWPSALLRRQRHRRARPGSHAAIRCHWPERNAAYCTFREPDRSHRQKSALSCWFTASRRAYFTAVCTRHRASCTTGTCPGMEYQSFSVMLSCKSCS
jgi:hypothetical protein